MPNTEERIAARDAAAEPGRPVLIANGFAWLVRQLKDAAVRKMMPVGTVAKDYFPLARRAEAAVAWLGNEKHNPGEPLHWARGKSDDHLDCLARHMTEPEDWDVTVLPDGRAYAVLHAAQAAWRASALAQLAAEKYGGTVIVQLDLYVPPQPPAATDPNGMDVVTTQPDPEAPDTASQDDYVARYPRTGETA